MSGMLRVGVIGVGSFGRAHVRIYSELHKEERVELVGVHDINEELAKAVANLHGTRALPLEELLSSVDAVSVVVPTSKHADVAVPILERGISALVEKPIADSVPRAREIIEAAKRGNSVLMVGHILRFHPVILQLRKILGKLGRLVSLGAERIGPFSERIRDVSVVLDLGVHDIDIFNMFYGGAPRSVRASGGSYMHPYGKMDAITALFDYGSGRGAVLNTNWLAYRKVRRLRLTGIHGHADADYIHNRIEVFLPESEMQLVAGGKEPLRAEIEAFVEAVEVRSRPPVTGEEGLEALAAALAAEMSASEGREVQLGEVLQD